MPKIILSLTLSTFLFLSGCTSCNTSKDTADTMIKEKVNEKESDNNLAISDIQNNIVPSDNAAHKSILEPFTPTIKTNINQDEVIAESLDELEIEAFKTIQPKIAKEMLNIPQCLEKAETKEEAFACSQTLRFLNKDMAMAMGDFRGEKEKGYDDDFVWNEETKLDMIKEIESGTQSMQEMQTCMEVSKTPEELEECLKP